MKFSTPQVNLYVENLETSRKFYERIGFMATFTAEIGGRAVHHEMVLDGFKLGVATGESARKEHGLNPGKNSGSEIVLWAGDTDEAIRFLLEGGAGMLSEPHDFLGGKLRVGWVTDPDGNPIQVVSKLMKE